MWNVDSSDEYDEWFLTLDEESKEAVLQRVSYYFDSAGKAFLLTGGDKKGKDQDKFYKDLIAESEIIYEKHEKELEDERRNQNDGK